MPSRRPAAASSLSDPVVGACAPSSIDNASGARALGLALGARGYRDAIVLAAGEGVVTSDDRTAGFTDGFTAAGGAVLRVYRGGFTRESGSQLMSQALHDGVEPGTLVFAISDVVAIGAMSADPRSRPRGRPRHRARAGSTTSPRAKT